MDETRKPHIPGHLRRLQQVWVEPTVYLITVCATQRQPLLATDAMAREVVDALRDAAQRTGWRVGRYVIMPDHIHLFCAPTAGAARLCDFVRRWKSWTTRRAWAMGHSGRLWQPEFFDHLLRSNESYSEKWDYVVQNPVRAGLCEQPEQWPYQGEIESLGM